MIEPKQKGSRLRASEVNELSARLEALERPRGARVRGAPGGGLSFERPVESVFIPSSLETTGINAGTVDLPAFSPAGIVGSHFTTAAGMAKDRLQTIRVHVPVADDAGWWVITKEPIAAGRAGTVVVSGIAPVRIYNDGDIPDRVDISAGQTYVVPSSSGSAQMIEEEDVSGEAHLAIVRLVGAGGGAGVETAKACGVGDAVSKSGPQTVDGVACTAGDQVLCTEGLYEVAAGAWSFKGTPDFVVILQGTARGETAYFKLNDTPTYRGLGAFYK